jgi:osmotically-inducible protein OsmY
MPTGSGPVQCDADLPDALVQEEVIAALRDDAGESVEPHLIRVSVRSGTVLLEGFQFDTHGRLAAAEAAANVPGVKEVVNMLVINAV